METSSSKQELFEYYNERAPEYEEFYWGRFGAKIPNPSLYENDTNAISRLLPAYVSGKCIDLACGTGFWLPVYEKGCSQITLIDQSEEVLTECLKKIQKLEIESKTDIICSDLFSHPFKENEYDSAVVGFLVSHLSEAELKTLFDILKTVLTHNSKFVIIDSTWNKEMVRMGRRKAGLIERTLSDGRRFNIFKRYFEKKDLYSMAEKNGIHLEIVYWGNVFFLAVASFSRH